jgi:hypothetical protein
MRMTIDNERKRVYTSEIFGLFCYLFDGLVSLYFFSMGGEGTEVPRKSSTFGCNRMPRIGNTRFWL